MKDKRECHRLDIKDIDNNTNDNSCDGMINNYTEMRNIKYDDH